MFFSSIGVSEEGPNIHGEIKLQIPLLKLDSLFFMSKYKIYKLFFKLCQCRVTARVPSVLTTGNNALSPFFNFCH